jgi:starch synthase
MPESKISLVGRHLPQGTQESGKQIRSFMPRYGCINERRNQLHEVIRLSGMNIVVNNIDRPLVIKVSSISSARMQVYFIDNEDYFHRKQIWKDDNGNYFDDNDERGIFFARGVLETVKKLRWKPDIVHCQGWISHFLPVYLKKVYKNDPIFADAKIVLSLYGEELDIKFSDNIISKYIFGSLKAEDLDLLTEPTGINLAKLAIKYSDGIIISTDSLHPELESYIGSRKGIPILPPMPIGAEETEYITEYNRFFDSFITPNPTNE